MINLKNWFPFRSPCQHHRNPEAPARTSAAGPLTVTAMRDEMDRMLERLTIKLPKTESAKKQYVRVTVKG
jgi:hypothetical protein